MKNVLWLCSWYPNAEAPFEGDFIQRHARAVALYQPVTVIHVTQYGENKETVRDEIQIREDQNLREIIVYFRFRPTGIRWLDKLRYNRTYYTVYKRIIRKYIGAHGVPGLIHLHIPMKAGVIARWIKGRWKVPYIVSEQASTYCPAAEDYFKKRSRYYQISVRKIFRKADRVTNVSQSVGEMIDRLCRVGDKGIQAIPNVADTRLFYFAPDRSGKFRFVHVSSLNEQKNPLGMLQGFKNLSLLRRDWELTLVGPVSDKLKRMIGDWQLEDLIACTGEIPYTDVAFHMRSASAFVLFSRHENLPCVLVEALCCGLPSVAADVGGVRDIIDEGNGILVPSDNVEALTAALIKIREGYDRFDREKISGAARSRFSYEVVGRQFEDIYRTL